MRNPAPRVVKPRKFPRERLERLEIRRWQGKITAGEIDTIVLWWEWLSGIGRMLNYIARWEASRRG